MNPTPHPQGARATGERSEKSIILSTHTVPRSLSGFLERRWPLVLFLLPLAILLLDHQWIFGDPVRDPWIYYGYFRNGPAYLVTFRHLYYSSRLSVILPGYWIHSLLAALPANFILHLAMYWASLFSFYGIARALVGARAALLAALCLGAHPFFLFAVGQNYVDGFGITYFLLALFALTFAGRVRLRKTLLVLAGACATAMVTANVFYAIYVPFLVVWFLVVDPRTKARAIFSAAALCCAGGGAAFAGFGLASKTAGGSFLYLLSSGRFLRGFVQQSNPFKAPARQWLPGAVWLAVPLLILIGCLIVFWRASVATSHGEARNIRFSQVLFLGFALLMLGFQLSPYAAVFQYSYYASLLIPLAWLALAGQIAFLLRAPGAASAPDWLAGLTAVLAVLAVLAAGMTLKNAQSFPLGHLPVLLTLLAGLGAPLVLWRGTGSRSAAFLLLSVIVSGGLAKQFAPFGRSFEEFHQDRADLFREIDQSVSAVRQVDRFGNVYFWWDASEDLAQIYDCIAATSLSGKRIVNLAFPQTLHGNLADGGRMAAGMKIAILSRQPRIEQAENALNQIGLRARALSTNRIALPNGTSFLMTFLELARAHQTGNYNQSIRSARN